MARRADRVEAAIERWEQAGLVGPDVAERLRAEAREHAGRSSGAAARYALAATGAVVLLAAVGVLGDWLWPLLDARGRSTVLLLTGMGVYLLGLYLRVRRTPGWRAASYGLQIAGLLTLLGTYGYSASAWPDRSLGGLVIGILALATPLVTAPASLLRRDPVMPAAHVALSLAFLAAFLDRGLGLGPEAIAWALDAALLLMTVLLFRALHRAWRDGEAESADWALHAFGAALLAGFVLVGFTAVGPFGMEERVVYPLLGWLALAGGLSLWGTHRAPAVLRRDWYEWQTALALLFAIPLLFALGIDLWDAPEFVTALLVGGVGALGLRYAVAHGPRTVLAVSCLAVIAAAWYYGASQGGAFGVVLALAGTAALLFWVSTRVGWRTDD